MGTGPCPVYKRGKRSGFFLLPQDHHDHGGGCTQHRHDTQCDIQAGVAVGGLGVSAVSAEVSGVVTAAVPVPPAVAVASSVPPEVRV